MEEKCYFLKNVLVGFRIFKEFSFNVMYKVKRRVLLVIWRILVVFWFEIFCVLEESCIFYEFVYFEIGDRIVFLKFIYGEIGCFFVVIFESIKFYVILDIVNRYFFDYYCCKFGIGIVLFIV